MIYQQTLAMMVGEIEFENIYFSAGQSISMKCDANGTSCEGEVNDEVGKNPYSATASLMILLFVFIVSMVVMNLLVGLAVSDIQVPLRDDESSIQLF